MEGKTKIKKSDSKTAQKNASAEEAGIKWYRRRWFWGVVIGGIIVITTAFYYYAPQNDFNSIIDLIVGIFWSIPLGVAVIILAITGASTSLWPVFLIIFRVLYLLFFVFLLYKTFRKPQAKIIYPILIIIIFIISALFGILANSFT